MGLQKAYLLGVAGVGFSMVVLGAGVSQAVTTVTISGTVLDSSGNPIEPPVTVALNGSAQNVTMTDAATGAYSFTVPAGSYSLTASTQCLVFAPNVVNLNNVKANTTANFVGSGNDFVTNCEPPASSGATTGTLTIHGVVTSGGQPVAGAKVQLNGSTQGFRYSDETGAYTFSVNRGSYSVSVSEGCKTYSPSTTNLNNISTSQTANFTGANNCPPAPIVGLCPALDTDFQLASLGDVCAPAITTNACIDRLDVWDSAILFDFFGVLGSDCRLGQFNTLFSSTAVNQYLTQVEFFIPYLTGCPYIGTQVGPLSDALVPAPLVAEGLKFTTADVAALSADFVAGFEQALSDNGTPITAAQLSAIQAQLTYLQANVPNVVASSKLGYSTCVDGGA